MRTSQLLTRPARRASAIWGGLLLTLAGAAGPAAHLVGDASRGIELDRSTLLVRVAWQPEPSGPSPGGGAAPEASGFQEAIVVMADGTRYTGRLVRQTDDEVVLEIGGIELALRRREVVRVDTLPPVVERYRRMRASIPDDDIPALLRLVEWLVSRREYDAAAKELLDVRRQEPGNPRVQELERMIAAQRALAEAGTSGSQPESGGEARDARPDRRTPGDVVLTDREVNLIRVYELDLDRLPRVVIPRSTVERLLEEFAGDPLIPMTQEGRDDLFRAARSNPRRVLEIIFRLRARHLYDQVQVIDNPRSMQMFRDRVHRTWLLNACASCHNTSPNAPRGPRFITRRPNSDSTVYSNFLILDRYRLADGTALINYDEPGDSPLLQMGLPRALVRRPHPDGAQTRGWTPVFLGESTSAYQNSIAWIRAMYHPRPEYPIVYPPPPEVEGPDPGPPVER